MAFARVPQSMFVVGEKMRQMRERLKSGGDRLRLAAASAVDEIGRGWGRLRQQAGNRWAVLRSPRRAAQEVGWSDAATVPPEAVPAENSILAQWRARYPKAEKALRIAAVALAVFLVMPYVFILLYRFVDPPVSALMLRNGLLGQGIQYRWADFENISPHLARAVVISEDARFCQHWGVDWHAVGEVLEDLGDGEAPRGASTIPMQTAKNLFLWPEQNYLRKALEVPLAHFMTLIWPKQRVIEVYLNVAEWGPGIYGAEAAARFHFNTSAKRLSRAQAALLAAALPNPYRRRAGRPGPQTRRLAGRIQKRVRREAHDAACIFAD